MSGPQFYHTQSFSRKANKAGQCVQQVIDELRRREEFATHVDNPMPPVLLFGLDVEALKSAHDQMVENGKTTVTLADGTNRVRAIRQDRHTLFTAVASYPVPRETIEADTTGKERVLFDRWKQLNIDFLKKKFGDQLKSVFEHVDETFGHIHAYVLPECFDDLNARNFNPAYLAKMDAEKQAEQDGAPPRLKVKLGNQAYRERARELADEYFEKVGQPAGLTREGPKRRRLSRSEWRKEKSHARAASQLALKAAENSMREELEPFREALEVVRTHRAALARRQAAEANESHREEATRIVADFGTGQRRRFAAAFAVLHGSSGELRMLARQLWTEALPDIEAPDDLQNLRSLIQDLDTTDLDRLQDAVEDDKMLGPAMDETKTLLHRVRQTLSDGLKAIWRSLEGFSRKIVSAFENCVEQVSKRLAEQEVVPKDQLEMPNAAAPFLTLPEDAQDAVAKAFPSTSEPTA
ncbi:hypothetical protein [Halovulum sp. GXIMD14793]